jgi:hypothetical protein
MKYGQGYNLFIYSKLYHLTLEKFKQDEEHNISENGTSLKIQFISVRQQALFITLHIYEYCRFISNIHLKPIF